jgi:putative methyltransferase (TIGR04325 family)
VVSKVKKSVLLWVPPVIIRVIKPVIFGRVRFVGPFESWHEAQSNSQGYDEKSILEKVSKSTSSVHEGIGFFERDSVVFNRLELSELLVAGLAVAATSGNINVLDVGGSLGSQYWQHRNLIRHLKIKKWIVVEQPHFVQRGNSQFADGVLSFIVNSEIKQGLEPISLVNLSGSLQFIENYVGMLTSVLKLNPQVIIIDKVFATSGGERIYVQHVPKVIYRGSYPFWRLNGDNLNRIMEAKGYELALKLHYIDFPQLQTINCNFAGFMWVKARDE